jgi:hypothetical protein
MHECRNVARGGAFRADVQSRDWIGYAIAKVLHLDISPDHKDHNKEGRVKVKNMAQK